MNCDFIKHFLLPRAALFLLFFVLIFVPITEAAKKKEAPKKKTALSAPAAASEKSELTNTASEQNKEIPPVVRPAVVQFPAQIPSLPAVPPQVPTIQEVQKQIDDMLRLNQALKAKYTGQADEVRRITEQARIHQRILNSLAVQKTPEPVQAPLATLQRVDAFKNAQINVINEETHKSKNYLETLRPTVQNAKPQTQPPQ